MKIRVLAQDGLKFSDEIEYAVVQNDLGQIAIMAQHVPVVTSLDMKGYVKLVSGDVTSYLVMNRGSLVFKDSTLSVFALTVQIGKTLEEAQKAFTRAYHDASDLSKKESIDYSKQERELREHVLKAKAGHI